MHDVVGGFDVVREERAQALSGGYRTFEKSEDELVLERRWRDGPARLAPHRKAFVKPWFLWCFGLFWVGHQIIWWSVAPVQLFAIPHLLIGVMLVGVMLARLFATTRITVRGGRLRVAHTIPWSGTHEGAVDDLLPLHAEAQPLPRGNASVSTWNLVSRNGVVLVDGLASEADAVALGARIEAHVAAPMEPASPPPPG